MSDSILEQWLETGTINSETVSLYADQAVMKEMGALVDEREQLEKDRAGQGATVSVFAMGEANPKSVFDAREAALDAREEALWERYEASKSEWTVRALLPAEVIAVRDKFEIPNAPKMLPAAAPAKAKAKWDRDFAEWKQNAERAEMLRHIHMVQKAVTEVKVGDHVMEGVTVVQVQALADATYGPQRLGLLVAAIERVTTDAGEMPRPKSLSGSESTAE